MPTSGLGEIHALLCNDAASNGKRHQAGNRTSKVIPEKRIESYCLQNGRTKSDVLRELIRKLKANKKPS